MSARLEILKESLKKKEAELDRRFDNHFSTVKQANGQPLNDKRNGAATLAKWEKQNDGIRNQKEEVEKTKRAIEFEESKITETEHWYKKMPKVLTDLIDSGVLIQWRKHPRMMFVNGVDKARIIFNDKTGVISHKYVSQIEDKDQYAIFRDTYNAINAEQKKNRN
jgi:hypothetical protein